MGVVAAPLQADNGSARVVDWQPAVPLAEVRDNQLSNPGSRAPVPLSAVEQPGPGWPLQKVVGLDRSSKRTQMDEEPKARSARG